MRNYRRSNRQGYGNRQEGGRFRFINSIQEFDMFGKSVPGFNLKGVSVIKSRLGAACTMILISLVMVYASTKFIQLDSRHNPNISSHI